MWLRGVHVQPPSDRFVAEMKDESSGMQAMTGWLDLDLQLRLKHLEDEYFAVVLPHIEKSLDVVDAEAGGLSLIHI